MDFRVLGPVEVLDADRRIPIGGPKQRSILAHLIADAGGVVPVDRIIQGTWGDDPPEGARGSLHTYVSKLRGEIGDGIRLQGEGYILDVPRESVDWARFEDTTATGTEMIESDPAAAAELLRNSLRMWRGHPYADVDGHGWLEPEIVRLNELRLHALRGRIEADLALGRHEELVGELEALAAEFPLHEGFRGQHMLALYRSGRQAEAIRAYDRTRLYLVEELGIEPTADLRQLSQQILEQDPSLDLDVGPQVRKIALVVSDLGDASVLTRLSPSDRHESFDRLRESTEVVVNDVGGRVFAQRGSALFSQISDVAAAVEAAEALCRLWAEEPVPARLAIDTGDVEVQPNDELSGPPVARAAALLAASHGGQVLLSNEAQRALADSERAGWQVRALGTHRLVGFERPEPVFEFVVGGRAIDFPPLRTDQAPPPLPGVSRSLRGYELRERHGSGGFAEVYRAYQSSLGREVAVKAIAPELANSPDFVRRFELEAQLIARLEHPNLVPLYDYWREPDGAFLVMRWLHGGSLAELLREQSPPLDSSIRIIRQVGSALAAAHRNGVVHQNIRASNVLLDEEGNAYLSDFGIAHWPAESAATVAGDIAAFSSLAAEVLGDHGIPSLTQVVERARHESTKGFATIESFLAAMDRAAGTTTAVPGFTPARNPYKGLAAFAEPDAPDFYGRSRIVDELTRRLATSRLLTVVGPSGIGKSSVVRAGLIPALREGAVPGSEEWFIADMVPGRFPFEELGTALTRVATTAPSDLDAELRADERAFVRTARRLLPPDAELLLVIDQFEELYTLTDSDTRTDFLTALENLVADERTNARVVLTIRADYLDQPLRNAGLGDLLLGTDVLVGAPARSEWREIVESPAANLGVAFEPGLVDRIISDIEEQPGALPLLEYALTELFEARDSDELTKASYDAAGGVLGALGRRADETYEGLDRGARDSARQVFLRMVGMDESGRQTRRRLSRSELGRLGIPHDTLEKVLGAFAAHRLITFDRDPISRGSTVEVAHEALFREWDLLAGWIDERGEDLLIRRRLGEAVHDWTGSDRSDDYLLTGGRLTQYESWAEGTDLSLSEAESDLLEASRRHADLRSSRRRRLRNLVTAGFAAAALIAGFFAITANRNADVARARELAALSAGVLDSDPQLGILLALEAVDSYRASGSSVERDAVEALHHSVLASRTLSIDGVDFGGSDPGEQGSYTPNIGYSPDGRLLATGTGTGVVLLRDPVSGHVVQRLEGHEGSVADLEWTTDGERLVTSSFDDGTIRIWDVAAGQEIRRLEPDRSPLIMSVDPDGTRIAMTGGDAEGNWGVGVLDAADGSDLWFEPIFFAIGVAYDPGGGRVVVTTRVPEQYGGGLHVLDSTNGEEHFYVPTPLGECDVTWSPDGTRILTTGDEGVARVWDATDGREVSRFTGHGSPVCNGDFNRDGTLVATGGEDGMARIWSADTGEEVLALGGHTERVGWVDFRPDGAVLATISADATFRTWDVTTTGREVLSVDVPGAVNGGDYAPAANVIALAGSSGRVHVLDADSGEEIVVLEHSEPVYSVALSSDGTKLVSGSGSGVVTVWELPAGREIESLDTEEDERVEWGGVPVLEVAISPGGDEIGATLASSLVVHWEPGAGSVRVLDSSPSPSASLSFSADGARLAAGAGGLASIDEIRIWDASTGDTQSEFTLERLFTEANSLEFTSDGASVLAAHSDGVIRVWDLSSEQVVAQFSGHAGRVWDATFSPDESVIASAGVDGTIRLWDVDSGELLLVLHDDPGPVSVSFSADGQRLVVTGSQGAHVYLTDVETLIELAQSRLARWWTPEECLQFLGTDTCPDRPEELSSVAPG